MTWPHLSSFEKITEGAFRQQQLCHQTDKHAVISHVGEIHQTWRGSKTQVWPCLGLIPSLNWVVPEQVLAKAGKPIGAVGSTIRFCCNPDNPGPGQVAACAFGLTLCTGYGAEVRHRRSWSRSLGLLVPHHCSVLTGTMCTCALAHICTKLLGAWSHRYCASSAQFA